jgi:hypothetical protein
MAFSRGAGIICEYQQRDIDLIVPVLHDDRTQIWEAEPKLAIFDTCRENAWWRKRTMAEIIE